ncbi:MAG: ankyrin repeat domain-containing protein [Desulfuromusa sp.]|nr:ankyrin repeat domain-containing protein [Desulfuromusa sp.]
MSKFSKIFGSLYFALNCLIFITIFILAIYTSGKYLQFSPGWIFLLFPGIGMLSGYWIRTGRYGWTRSLIIAVSLLCSIIFLFIAFVAGPQLEKLEAEKVAKIQKIQKIELDKKVEQMFLGVYGGDLEIVKKQLAKGVDVNVVNETRQTALHVTQHVDIAQLLIERGANIHAKDDTGATPIFNKEIEITTLLLDAGVDINSRNEKGNTLLIRYTYAGYVEGIKFLVARGADINSCNLDHHNAMDIAEHFQPNTTAIRYLQTLNIQPCAK